MICEDIVEYIRGAPLPGHSVDHPDVEVPEGSGWCCFLYRQSWASLNRAFSALFSYYFVMCSWFAQSPVVSVLLN